MGMWFAWHSKNLQCSNCWGYRDFDPPPLDLTPTSKTSSDPHFQALQPYKFLDRYNLTTSSFGTIRALGMCGFCGGWGWKVLYPAQLKLIYDYIWTKKEEKEQPYCTFVLNALMSEMTFHWKLCPRGWVIRSQRMGDQVPEDGWPGPRGWVTRSQRMGDQVPEDGWPGLRGWVIRSQRMGDQVPEDGWPGPRGWVTRSQRMGDQVPEDGWPGPRGWVTKSQRMGDQVPEDGWPGPRGWVTRSQRMGDQVPEDGWLASASAYGPKRFLIKINLVNMSLNGWSSLTSFPYADGKQPSNPLLIIIIFWLMINTYIHD